MYYLMFTSHWLALAVATGWSQSIIRVAPFTIMIFMIATTCVASWSLSAPRKRFKVLNTCLKRIKQKPYLCLSSQYEQSKECKNKNCDRWFPLNLFLGWVKIFPAFENNLSDGTEVPTIDKYCLTKSESTLIGKSHQKDMGSWFSGSVGRFK